MGRVPLSSQLWLDRSMTEKKYLPIFYFYFPHNVECPVPSAVPILAGSFVGSVGLGELQIAVC